MIDRYSLPEMSNIWSLQTNMLHGLKLKLPLMKLGPSLENPSRGR